MEVFTIRYPRVIFRRLATVLALSLLVLAWGCSTSGMKGSDKTSRDWYEEGMTRLAKKRYQGAAEAFQEASTLYRDAALDADIHMALGDTYFADKLYDQAIQAYREFLRLHPRNSRSDRAQFQIGMSYFKQLRGKDRSQEPTQLALEAFEKIVRNYPRSNLMGDAKEKIVFARRRLADHELYVGQYYMRTKAYQAALPRFDRVYHEYRDLGYGDDGLYYLGLCYLKLKQNEKAMEVWDRLQQDYPHSRHLKSVKSKRKGKRG